MSFVSKQELKAHINLTADDIEFDQQLPRFIAAAEGKVKAFCNRGIYEVLPVEPLEYDMLVNDEIRLAILDVAGYYFDAKGQIDIDMISNMLDSYIGHYQIKHHIGADQ